MSVETTYNYEDIVDNDNLVTACHFVVDIFEEGERLCETITECLNDKVNCCIDYQANPITDFLSVNFSIAINSLALNAVSDSLKYIYQAAINIKKSYQNLENSKKEIDLKFKYLLPRYEQLVKEQLEILTSEYLKSSSQNIIEDYCMNLNSFIQEINDYNNKVSEYNTYLQYFRSNETLNKITNEEFTLEEFEVISKIEEFHATKCISEEII